MKRGKVPGIVLWLVIITPATVNLFKGGGWGSQPEFALLGLAEARPVDHHNEPQAHAEGPPI